MATDKQPLDEKTPRLFLRSPEITDNVSIHCGGPTIQDAISGLIEILENFKDSVDDDDHNLSDVAFGIYLDIKEMTDAEVAALPDV